MRTLHAHSGNLFGGIETILVTIARAEAAHTGLRSSFALAFEGRLADELNGAGAPVRLVGRVQLRRPDQVRRARQRLRRLIEREPVDLMVVHSSWSLAVFGTVAREAGLPLVLWLHAPHPGPWWLAALARRVPPDLVICNSRYTQSLVADRYGAERLAVCYAPLPVDRYRCDPDSRAEARRSLGLDTPTPVIAMAARLEPLKGHHTLIEALGALPTALDWRCWIIGGAQRAAERRYEGELRQAVLDHGLAGRISFLGEHGDVARLLCAADIYCQPNTSGESFGLSYVEALAAGLPVVTSRTGAAAEIVDSSCGVLLEPGDRAGLTRVLAALVADPAFRLRLGQHGPPRAAALCGVSSQLRRLEELLAHATAVKPVCRTAMVHTHD